MIGAIIGDIVGSRFEWNNYRKKDFILFTEDCFATDDSIMLEQCCNIKPKRLIYQKQRYSGCRKLADLIRIADSAEASITGFTVMTPSPTTVSATGQPCESVPADYLPRHWKQHCR